jgi:hypothetical protein
MLLMSPLDEFATLVPPHSFPLIAPVAFESSIRVERRALCRLVELLESFVPVTTAGSLFFDAPLA